MVIKAELNYLEFHNTKDKLESGFYRVIEADGEESYAQVTASPWRGPCSVKWMTEDEYLEYRRMDHYLAEDWNRDGDEFHRIRPEDLAETDANNNSELFDAMVYGIQPDDLHATEGNIKGGEVEEPKTLADLLREAWKHEVVEMTDEQYAEHCEVVAQNHKDGIHL